MLCKASFRCFEHSLDLEQWRGGQLNADHIPHVLMSVDPGLGHMHLSRAKGVKKLPSSRPRFFSLFSTPVYLPRPLGSRGMDQTDEPRVFGCVLHVCNPVVGNLPWLVPSFSVRVSPWYPTPSGARDASAWVLMHQVEPCPWKREVLTLCSLENHIKVGVREQLEVATGITSNWVKSTGSQPHAEEML